MMKSTSAATDANARLPDLLVRDGDAKAVLHQHDQLEGVDRIQPEPLSEDGGIVGNVGGWAVQSEARHQELLHLGEHGGTIHRPIP